MQEELDKKILENMKKDIATELIYDLDDLLTEKLLALQVEVSELANATRCFKYWSMKGPEQRERLLEEYADVLHFFLSVGLALGFTPKEVEQAYTRKNKENYRRQETGY